LQDDWSAPFDTWEVASLPTSRTFILPGQLFLVRFEFKADSGYYLTIEPSPYVYRIHDLNKDHEKDQFGFFVCDKN